MRHLKLLTCIVVLLCCSMAFAQQPTDGHLQGSTYLNSYFHFVYTTPRFLKPFDTASLHLPPPPPHPHEFLLFSARQGEEPYGIVIIAEKLGPVGQHAGLKSGSDFINWVIRGFEPSQQISNIHRFDTKNPEGVTFNEVDYVENGEPSSAIATRIGEFLIVFKCNAKSTADLSQMTSSATALHIQK